MVKKPKNTEPSFATAQSRALIEATVVVMKNIPKSFSRGLTTQKIGKPDYNKICKEQDKLAEALSSLGIRVIRLPADESKPDSYFPRDTLLSYRGVMFKLNPGSAQRRKEVRQNVSDLKELGIPVKHVSYDSSAFVEGGDVLAIESEHLVVVGISDRKDNVRTNKAGVGILANVLHSIDPEVTVAAVPHNGVLHLETGLTPVTKELALKDPKCIVRWDKAYYPIKGSSKISLPPWKIKVLPANEGYSAHVLPVNGSIIIAKGYPTTNRIARSNYPTVIEVPTSELQKMDGSLRCLTVLHNENPQ